MTNRTLQQRAHALQEEVARALEPGNKKRLKHTEAMDILARVDGHRNREAARSDQGEKPDASAEPADARPTFDPTKETFSFDVRFEDGIGFLGARTNGAPPDAVTGIRIECNNEDPDVETDHPETASVWLHPTRETLDGRDHDWMLSANGWSQMKAVLAMVMDAERKFATKPIADVPLFANMAQVGFDDSVGEELYDNTMLRCVTTAEGFDLNGESTYRNPRIKHDGRPTPTICRLEGRFGRQGLHRLARMIAEADAWYEKRRISALAKQRTKKA